MVFLGQISAVEEGVRVRVEQEKSRGLSIITMKERQLHNEGASALASPRLAGSGLHSDPSGLETSILGSR